MKYKTAEEHLWELKMTLIKTIPPFLTATLALSAMFSLMEAARTMYFSLGFLMVVIFLLAIAEIVSLDRSSRKVKKRK